MIRRRAERALPPAERAARRARRAPFGLLTRLAAGRWRIARRTMRENLENTPMAIRLSSRTGTAPAVSRS
jgi:hypothetical protein